MTNKITLFAFLALLHINSLFCVPRTRSPEIEAYIPTEDYTQTYGTRGSNEKKEKDGKTALMTANALQFFTGLIGVALNNDDKEKQGQHLTNAVSGIVNLLHMVVKHNPDALRSEYDFARTLQDVLNEPQFRSMLTAQVERRTLAIVRHYATTILENEQNV